MHCIYTTEKLSWVREMTYIKYFMSHVIIIFIGIFQNKFRLLIGIMY